MLRISQQLGDYTMLSGSTESFWLQIYVEMGIMGLACYLLPIAIAFFRGSANSNNYVAVLCAFLICGFFTPALYGLTTGLLFGVVVALCFCRKSYV